MTRMGGAGNNATRPGRFFEYTGTSEVGLGGLLRAVVQGVYLVEKYMDY